MRLLFAFLGLALLSAPLGARGSESEALVAPREIEKEDFFKPALAPVRGRSNYDVTIVYFFDYQCPQCRAYHREVERVMREARRVRWIYRDIPHIGPQSRKAARLAIAASFQARHHAFHHALMSSKGRLSDIEIRAAARRAKVDWAKLQRDLKTHEQAIDAQLTINERLADAMGLYVTPGYIIGNTQYEGALDANALREEIAKARKDQPGS